MSLTDKIRNAIRHYYQSLDLPSDMELELLECGDFFVIVPKSNLQLVQFSKDSWLLTKVNITNIEIAKDKQSDSA